MLSTTDKIKSLTAENLVFDPMSIRSALLVIAADLDELRDAHFATLIRNQQTLPSVPTGEKQP
jgi:hypothetical protein